MIPINLSEAIEATDGAHCRQMPPGKYEYDFLRCQIGNIVGMDYLGFPIFHLRAFGSSWDRAYAMWREKLAMEKE